jgi:REP element-mobilizing transposase RayT
MSEIKHKQHNVSTLIYHIVCPAKYRRAVITKEADGKLREICLGTEARYEIKFLETGTEKNHARFLVQPVPAYSPEKTVRTIKSLMARTIFEECPEVKKMLWGGEFWTRGYYAGTVGEHGNEQAIQQYVRNQGRKPEDYQKIQGGGQLELFLYQNKA